MFSYCAFLLWETPSLSLSLKPLKWVFVLVSVNDFKSDNTDIEVYTSNPVNTDTEGAIESVRIKRVEFRGNERAIFPLGQIKLSVIMRFLY